MRWLRCLGWAAMPLLLVTPWYWRILQGLSLPANRITAQGPAELFRSVLGQPLLVWGALCVLALAGWLATVMRPGALFALLTSLNLVALVGLLVNEARAGFVLPSALAVAICANDDAVGQFRRLAAVTAVAAVLTFVAIAPSTFTDQVDFYTRFTPRGTLSASSWLSAHAAPGDRVVAAPVDGVPTGWWIEAAGLDALVAARNDWLFFGSERSEAALANALLSGASWPSEEAIGRLQDCDVVWVFLPAGWSGADPSSLGQAVRNGQFRLAYEDRDTLVIAVKRLSGGGSTARPDTLPGC